MPPTATNATGLIDGLGVPAALTRKRQELDRIADITKRGRFSKTHLYNLIARGHFPDAAIRDGTRFTRWHSADVDAWFADPAGWIARAEAAKAALISDGAAL